MLLRIEIYGSDENTCLKSTNQCIKFVLRLVLSFDLSKVEIHLKFSSWKSKAK
jgi:hypothetical protein